MSECTQVFATLAGIVVGAAIGVVSGFLLQRQLFKREDAREMRDRVYGPMLRQTSKMLEDITYCNLYTGLANLKGLMDDYLFFTIEPDLKSGFSEVLDSFEKYEKVRHAAELALDDAVRQYYKETLGLGVTGTSGGAEDNYLKLLMGKPMASNLDLKRAVFLKRAPQDFLKKEKEKLGENVRIEVSICGFEKKLEDFESLYASMLVKMEKDPYYLDEGKQRMHLEKELKKLIGQIEPFVKLERAHTS